MTNSFIVLHQAPKEVHDYMLPVVMGGIVEGVVSTGVGGAIVFGMIGAMVLLSG